MRHQLLLAAGQARGSRSARPSIRRRSSAAQVRATTSSRGSARFIGPKATSSKTVSVTCDSWVAGFWKPMPMRWLSRCIGQASTSSPSRVIVPRIWPPTVLRRQSADDQAERRLAGLGGTDEAEHLAVAQLEVDVEQCRPRGAGVAVADPGEGDRHPSHPGEARGDDRDEPDDERPAQRGPARPSRAATRGGSAGPAA